MLSVGRVVQVGARDFGFCRSSGQHKAHLSSPIWYWSSMSWPGGRAARAIAAQVLCDLAESDRSNRMLHDFPALFAVTGDERFVTARHCLQALWKVGAAGKEQQRLLLTALEKQFNNCVTHKNCTLIRYDVIKCLRDLYDAVNDDNIRVLAHRLIDSEQNLKYRKKYSAIWR
jgi:hypothetical protein